MISSPSDRISRKGATAEMRRTLTGVLTAYGGILFVEQPLIGLAFLTGTFWFPNVGLAGLIGAAVGMFVGYGLKLPSATSGVNVYSSLLVGLSLGAYYELSPNLALLITLSSALTVLLAATLRSFLWQLGHLPVLSLPFVIVALTAALAASTYGGLDPYYEPSQLPPAVFDGGTPLGVWTDTFFAALGSTFFSPHPAVGALLFVGILLRSRYLALLCVTGFLSGQIVFATLAAEPPAGLLTWTGFNFALTAMAVGGIFTVPSVLGFVIAMTGAGASAVVSGALTRYLLVYNLPVMALPFLLTTLTLLAALRMRVGTASPILLLESPGLPEANFERARLARARLGSIGSVPLLAPFLGEWQVYQGFNGQHTHREQWRYALDFLRLENGRSHAGVGDRLEDYYAFGLPVLSPAYGLVFKIEDSHPDNPPGELELQSNWGNYVLIQADSGVFVLLAHLKQHSVSVREGARVTPSTPIGSCGNSGRSPQPHLHLQVQAHSGLGGGTLPFHLVSCIATAAGQPPRYQLVTEPHEGWSIQRAEEDPRLAAALRLPVGRELNFSFTAFDGTLTDETLTVEVTLLGQFRVVTRNGASAAFEQRNGTLAFYDRQGPTSEFLDLWLLALGLTPLSCIPSDWRDAPAARLLPLAGWERVALGGLRPLGAGLEAHYERRWSESEEVFRQSGRHLMPVMGLRREATTEVHVSPEQGPVRLSIAGSRGEAHAELVAVGQRGDLGIPSWRRTLGPQPPPTQRGSQ